MPLVDFRNFIASRRVLVIGRIVSGFSFCNSLFVVSLSDLSKIAIKFAVFDNLPSPSSVGRNFSSLNGSMPGNAKDNHWKIPPSKSSAAATTPASSRTRPKQSIPAGKPLCCNEEMPVQIQLRRGTSVFFSMKIRYTYETQLLNGTLFARS